VSYFFGHPIVTTECRVAERKVIKRDDVTNNSHPRPAGILDNSVASVASDACAWRCRRCHCRVGTSHSGCAMMWCSTHAIRCSRYTYVVQTVTRAYISTLSPVRTALISHVWCRFGHFQSSLLSVRSFIFIIISAISYVYSQRASYKEIGHSYTEIGCIKLRMSSCFFKIKYDDGDDKCSLL